MPVVRLTAKERILIHLADFASYAEAVEVPPDMGQEAIARAAGIYVQHVRQFLEPLLKEGFVRERTAHVKGHRRRLKVYDLTDSGRLAAAHLREQVRGVTIRVRDAGGVRETTVRELLREAPGKIPLAAVVRVLQEGAVVDLATLGIGPSGFLAFLAEAPRLETFVGRQEELAALTREDGGPRVFLVRGVAGIGKSSLAAKACEQLKATRNVYWHRIRSWDTRASILAGLADFLAALGRPGLRAVLGRGDAAAADSIVREDLAGTRSVLVFDDVHEGTPEILRFLRFLKDAIADAPDVRAIVLSRRTVPIHDRRDVTIRGLVQEIDLRGLGAEDVKELLAADPEGARLQAVARTLGGHPLFLELLRSPANRGLATESIRDVRRFIEEEIYADLSDPERRMMKAASLYAVPFPREALFADATLSHDVLLSLAAKSLIRPEGGEAYGVHDTIREFFVSILSPAEFQTLAPLAVVQLRRLSERAEASKDFVAALNCLSNARNLATSPDEQSDVLEALGDAHEGIGDLPAALTAYREALRCSPEPEAGARLHRKIAAALIVRGEIGPASAEIEAGFRALGPRPSVERGWFDLLECRAASYREDWAEAREHGEAALAAFQGSAEVLGQAETLMELASVAIYSLPGNPAEAERFLTSALDVSESVGGAEFRARVQIQLANLYANRIGDVDRATRAWEAVDALRDAIRDPHIRRSYFMMKAWFTLYQLADYRAAEDLFTQAVGLARRIHDPATLSFARYGLAHVLYFDGKVDAAREAFAEVTREMDAQEFSADAMDARWMVAECCLRLEDLDGFRRIASEYRDPARAEGVAARPVQARVLEGLEALVAGDRDRCERAFREALRLIETQGETPNAMLAGLAHFFYGLALRVMHRTPEADQLLRNATALLEARGFRAQLSAMRQAEPQLVEFLRRTSTAKAVGAKG